MRPTPPPPKVRKVMLDYALRRYKVTKWGLELKDVFFTDKEHAIYWAWADKQPKNYIQCAWEKHIEETIKRYLVKALRDAKVKLIKQVKPTTRGRRKEDL